MSASRSVIRKLYRDAILQVFGCGDKELDTDLTKALKSDVHLGGKDPGQWSDKGAVLSIYCENGIPNASDIHDFTHEFREFGIEGNPVSYNSEKWFKIDGIVNLYLEATSAGFGVFHEPCNGAVVNVYQL